MCRNSFHAPWFLFFLRGGPLSPLSRMLVSHDSCSLFLVSSSELQERNLYLLKLICTNRYAHIYHCFPLAFYTAFLGNWAVTDCGVNFNCTVCCWLFFSTDSLQISLVTTPEFVNFFYDFESTWRHSEIVKLQTRYFVKRLPNFEDLRITFPYSK